MNNIDSLFCPDIMNKPTSTEGRPKKATSGFFSEGNGSVARASRCKNSNNRCDFWFKGKDSKNPVTESAKLVSKESRNLHQPDNIKHFKF